MAGEGITRWEMDVGAPFDCEQYVEAVESDDGEWVYYGDHIKAVAEAVPTAIECPPNPARPAPEITPKCEACRFFFLDRADPGECRRRAPARLPEADIECDPDRSPWQAVSSDDWCGEHEPKAVGNG